MPSLGISTVLVDSRALLFNFNSPYIRIRAKYETLRGWINTNSWNYLFKTRLSRCIAFQDCHYVFGLIMFQKIVFNCWWWWWTFPSPYFPGITRCLFSVLKIATSDIATRVHVPVFHYREEKHFLVSSLITQCSVIMFLDSLLSWLTFLLS